MPTTFIDMTTEQRHTLNASTRVVVVPARDVQSGVYANGGTTFDGHPEGSFVVGDDRQFDAGDYLLVWDENGDGRGTEETDAMEDPQVYWLSRIVTTYRIAPASDMDFEAAGKGNEFTTYEAAASAAESMDSSNPLDEDTWEVFESNGLGGWTRASA